MSDGKIRHQRNRRAAARSSFVQSPKSLQHCAQICVHFNQTRIECK